MKETIKNEDLTHKILNHLRKTNFAEIHELEMHFQIQFDMDYCIQLILNGKLEELGEYIGSFFLWDSGKIERSILFQTFKLKFCEAIARGETEVARKILREEMEKTMKLPKKTIEGFEETLRLGMKSENMEEWEGFSCHRKVLAELYKSIVPDLPSEYTKNDQKKEEKVESLQSTTNKTTLTDVKKSEVSIETPNGRGKDSISEEEMNDLSDEDEEEEEILDVDPYQRKSTKDSDREFLKLVLKYSPESAMTYKEFCEIPEVATKCLERFKGAKDPLHGFYSILQKFFHWGRVYEIKNEQGRNAYCYKKKEAEDRPKLREKRKSIGYQEKNTKGPLPRTEAITMRRKRIEENSP
eukprot:TRINITY_DN2114_c0_g1_i4.p1 TRINITY_DN2114_c0_g1~~TRINITY_DN2114_c0_g1_i4.p1  ORF type:complete len:354 (-),score=119.85 TRINITY_DN2114_c0_g1_i4:239-1300(-)